MREYVVGIKKNRLNKNFEEDGISDVGEDTRGDDHMHLRDAPSIDSTDQIRNLVMNEDYHESCYHRLNTHHSHMIIQS
jgi:hypothetical protein